jgi:hypothetical protein
MKEFNLNRLMQSCCVEIDAEYYDELFDYLIDMDVDLNHLNIDDLVVNGIQFLDKEDAEEHELYILKETDTGVWCL